jgi:pimeloyl-ACP methyl ester carboxylesterase
LAVGAGIALLSAVGAPAVAAAAPLAFAPCTERTQAGWECATLVAPLDHSGATPGTVELRVQRLAHDGPPRTKAIVNIEGGPGGSTTGRSAQTRRLLAGPTERNGYDLILLDTRATGASRPQTIELGTARFYSTAATVRDLELLRAGLGIERLAVVGTSYSTLYAAEFARTFPERTDRIVLDSPIGPDGPDLFGTGPIAATMPAVRDLCRRSACPGGPGAIAKGLDAIMRRARRGAFTVPSRFVWTRRGRPVDGLGDTQITPEGVITNISFADERTARYAQLPAAIHAAARGDYRAFARGLFSDGASESGIEINRDLNRITLCLDARVPWAFEAPAEQRRAAAAKLMASVALGPLRPWPARLLGFGTIWECQRFGPSGLPDAIKGGAIPNVPGVILHGAWDLRTPPADARALAAAWPSGTLVTAPATGHGVLRSATPCATEALDALLGGRAVDGQVCADTRPVAEPLQVASIADDVRPLPGVPRTVARTAAAVVATLRDAEVEVALAAPRGGSMLQAGLVEGWVRGSRTPPSPAVRAALGSYALLDGLELTGTFAAHSTTSWTAKVKLSGRHRGSVTISKGRLRGTIDGRSVDVRLPGAFARPAVTRYG